MDRFRGHYREFASHVDQGNGTVQRAQVVETLQPLGEGGRRAYPRRAKVRGREKDEDKNANDLADAVVSGEGPKTPRLQLDSDDKAKKGEAGRKEEAEEWRWLLKQSNE